MPLRWCLCFFPYNAVSRRRLLYIVAVACLLSQSACSTAPPPPAPTTLPPSPTVPLVSATVTPLPATPTAGPSPAPTLATPITTTLNLAPLQPLQDTKIVDRPLANVQPLTDGATKYQRALWSPGSDWLAAVPQDGPGLDVINSATGEVRAVVTDTFVLEPIWLDDTVLVVQRTGPDGDELVRFEVADDVIRSTVIVTDSGPMRAVGASDGVVAFGSSDQQLKLVQTTEPIANTTLGQFAPLIVAVQPRSQIPAIAVNRQVASLEQIQTILVQQRPDGITSTVLTNEGEALGLPVWSRDGDKLVLTSIEGRLVSTTLDGTARYDLGPGNLPSWSPDGSRIAFAGTSAGAEYTTRDIYLVDWQGTTARLRLRLAGDGQLFTSPSWSPDGLQLAFVEIDSGQLFVGDVP